MALKIKLSRYGRKKLPFYRVVVVEARSKRDGNYVDLLGFYNPLTHPATLEINHDKTNDWITKGAKPTDTVAYLLKKENFTWTKSFKAPASLTTRKKKSKKDKAREESAKEAATKQAEEKAAAAKAKAAEVAAEATATVTDEQPTEATQS
ncbi:MAG: 30S ribosomal protein S16 [bacterium]